MEFKLLITYILWDNICILCLKILCCLLVELPTGVSDQERGCISEVLGTVKAHADTLKILDEDHSGQAASIEQKALNTFQQRYMVG